MPSLLDTFKTLFKPRPVKLVGDALYAACVDQARLPRFYLDYGVEDVIGARFELLTLHVVMVVTTLKSALAEQAPKEQADETAQALFDAFLLALDTTLREQGTGDLTVPKKMAGIGKVVYTRLKRWDDLWKAGEGAEVQAAYVARTIYAGDDESADMPDAVVSRAAALTVYIEQARSSFDLNELLAGRLAWPAPVALNLAV